MLSRHYPLEWSTISQNWSLTSLGERLPFGEKSRFQARERTQGVRQGMTKTTLNWAPTKCAFCERSAVVRETSRYLDREATALYLCEVCRTPFPSGSRTAV